MTSFGRKIMFSHLRIRSTHVAYLCPLIILTDLTTHDDVRPGNSS